MKKIIYGRIYDTEKAELVMNFRRKVKSITVFGELDCWAESELYKTRNGNWFEVVGTDFKEPDWNPLTPKEAKKIISVDPDKFCELYPDEVEEA